MEANSSVGIFLRVELPWNYIHQTTEFSNKFQVKGGLCVTHRALARSNINGEYVQLSAIRCPILFKGMYNG